MEKRLEQRHQALQQNLQNRKTERKSGRDPSENVDAFFLSLEQECVGVRKKASEDVDDAMTRLSALKALVSRSAYFLPNYDLRKALQTVTLLEEEVRNVYRSKPRPKFAFSKSKKSHSSASASVVPPNEKNNNEKFNELLQLLQKEEIAIHDIKSSTLYRGPSSLNGSDVSLCNIADSTVSLCDTLGAIRIHHLSNSTVLCGPVAGSVHLEDCKGSTLVLASRQIRIHRAHHCDFYLLCASSPIIEDSTNVRFAPYNLSYDVLGAQLASASLAGIDNCWADVKDFKWLRQQHSPNWSEIPPSQRIQTFHPQISDDNQQQDDEDEI